MVSAAFLTKKTKKEPGQLHAHSAACAPPLGRPLPCHPRLPPFDAAGQHVMSTAALDLQPRRPDLACSNSPEQGSQHPCSRCWPLPQRPILIDRPEVMTGSLGRKLPHESALHEASTQAGSKTASNAVMPPPLPP